jgi:hypothetical protein
MIYFEKYALTVSLFRQSISAQSADKRLSIEETG